MRVVIISDSDLGRHGLRGMLSLVQGIEIVWEGTGTPPPDKTYRLAVASFAGDDVLAEDKLSNFHLRDTVLMVSERISAQTVCRLLRLEVRGIVSKNISQERFEICLQTVSTGNTDLDRDVAPYNLMDLLRAALEIGQEGRSLTVLTTRERQVMTLLAKGNSVKEIAESFNLSAKTVDAHKFNLMRKLDIHNKAQLVQYALRHELIRLPPLKVVS